jgi:hypothetical protein
METEMDEADEIQALIKGYEDAHTRYDELMPVAHTKTRGVEATPEPDDPALRDQRREAKGARDEAWRDLKELLHGV